MSETLANAIEVLAPDANASAQVEENKQGAGANAPLEKDQFGRDAAERIVELSSEDAEAIGKEVNDGKWHTYDEALHYVLSRGFAEIKRTREAALKNAAKTELAETAAKWQGIMQGSPELLQNTQLVAKMFAEISALSQKAAPKKK